MFWFAGFIWGLSVVLGAEALIHPVVRPGSLGTLISGTVNHETEMIFQFEVDQHLVEDGALRVFVSSDHSAAALPLLVVVRYTQGVLSWQLPLLVKTDLGNDIFRMSSYNSVNRTLCPAKNYPLKLMSDADPVVPTRTVLVSFSTASPQEVQFQLRCELADQWKVGHESDCFSYSFSISDYIPRNSFPCD